MTSSEQTFAEICAAFERIIGRPIDDYETPRVHPMQEEADARRIERAEILRDHNRTYGDGR